MSDLEATKKELATVYTALGDVQKRCTELLDETRLQRRQLTSLRVDLATFRAMRDDQYLANGLALVDQEGAITGALLRAEKAERELRKASEEIETLAKDRYDAVCDAQRARDEVSILLGTNTTADRALRSEIVTILRCLERGREKYPRGASSLALFDEVGEYARAVNKNERWEREQDELRDVIVVALRLLLGETEAASDEADWRAVEAGADASAARHRDAADRRDR